MKDSEIIHRLEQRDESALSDISDAYGNLGRQIAMRILGSESDTDECLNDALLRIWNSIPPAKPRYLKAYYSAVVRNTALNKHTYNTAEKRGAAEVSLVLDELSEVLADGQDVQAQAEASMLGECIRQFLHRQKAVQQKIFMQRYFYMMTGPEIAAGLGITENRVTVTLHRMRQKLREHLEQEGYL
ncbi:MAG: sigma-70 family RNA polymerase sigma factor [Oscillospiraceae bacterium]|nr:sigma-70 family RNA polymerase sigma factor [Oscillospiraceae bacterium]